ncbi:hypothetical protein ANO14919_110670 [Xylariales sp. No.14919]|nr:hypothetical protein ANO14919_110670 [Xylariales sp. No.14919]
MTTKIVSSPSLITFTKSTPHSRRKVWITISLGKIPPIPEIWHFLVPAAATRFLVNIAIASVAA